MIQKGGSANWKTVPKVTDAKQEKERMKCSETSLRQLVLKLSATTSTTLIFPYL